MYSNKSVLNIVQYTGKFRDLTQVESVVYKTEKRYQFAQVATANI
jgi:hypothetical protein